MISLRRAVLFGCIAFLLCHCTATRAQTAEVTGKLQFQAAERKSNVATHSRQAVVWLTPVDREIDAPPPKTAQLVQKDKAFHPAVVVIPAGSTVEFPNHDPFFHNVFSLFEGKRFDLGMYEAGSSRTVRFDRPGISYIFCNIHPEMSAVVIALRTPYFAWADANGNFSVRDVPPGRYQLAFWALGATPEALDALTRTVTISSSSATIAPIDVPITDWTVAHKNKYGREYDPAATAPYEHP